MEKSDTLTSAAINPLVSAKNIELFYWAGALVATLAVRLCLFFAEYSIHGDGIRYIDAARDFYEGRWAEGLGSFYPPFFPLLIAVGYPITGGWELAGRLWPFVLGVLMLLPLWAILKRLYGVHIAGIGLLIYGVSPYLARFAVDVRTEVPYTFFFLTAMYFFLKAIASAGRAAFFFGGASAALAYLQRPEGIGLVMVGCAYLALRPWGGGSARMVWQGLALLLIGFFLFAAPYILYLRWDSGGWTISRKTANVLAIGMTTYDKEIDSVRREASDKTDALNLVTSRPLIFIKKVVIDGFRTWDAYATALHFSALPFLLLGWIVWFRGRFWEKDDFFLLAVIAFYFAVFSIFFPSRRFTTPLVPISLGWVGLGFMSLDGYFRSRLSPSRAVVAMGFVVVLFVAATLPKTLKGIGDKPSGRAAAAYLEAKPNRPLILTNRPQIAFYTPDSRVVQARAEEFFDRLAAVAPDYLVVDDELFEREAERLGESGWSVERRFHHFTIMRR
jgi:4-amino-4-deoxy-L-arabinose transferase-like glycosyltransferase